MEKPQNPDVPITKRIHIGGLTPAITLADLNKRLATFGTIEGDISGIGKVDAVGRPQSFIHVTLNTTAGKLSKCMNVLSGSTWKGAKLRLGEAKPDYREKLAAERAEDALLASQPPRKKQRTQGVHAADMSLVTPEIAAKKPGWKVTEMGRVLRLVRMRPDHPLPPTLEEVAKSKALKSKGKASESYKKGKGKKGDEKEEKRKRKKDPAVRARRVTIDVTKWDSTQLKGMFLESQSVPGLKTKKVVEPVDEPMEDEEDSDASEAEDEQSDVDSEEESEAEVAKEDGEDVPTPAHAERASSPLFPTKPTAPSTTSRTTTIALPTPAASVPAVLPDNNTDVLIEKSRALNLLSSLFAGADDDDDWIGRESVGSDVDEEALLMHERRPTRKSRTDEVDFEIVPKDDGKSGRSGPAPVDDEDGDDEDGDDEEMAEKVQRTEKAQPDPVGEEPKGADAKQPELVQTAPNLKDMFAPREEEGGFSLLGHLDIDIDLDEELAFALEAPSVQPTTTPSYLPTSSFTPSYTSPAPATAPSTTTYINPREPLFFFPSMDRSSQPSSMFFTSNPSKKNKDAVDVLAEKGWHWRDANVKFYRTDEEEEIRKEWEEKRGDLTKGWKRRAREAGKAGRRRGKGAGAGEDV